MIAFFRSFLSLFQRPPKDNRSEEERRRVERAWVEVFRRLREKRDHSPIDPHKKSHK